MGNIPGRAPPRTVPQNAERCEDGAQAQTEVGLTLIAFRDPCTLVSCISSLSAFGPAHNKIIDHRLVKTVEFVLRSFLHRETQLTLDRFPRQHFCTQQAILVGIFVLHGLQHERLTFLDVREDLGNLAYLLDFIRCYYPSDAAYLQSYLRKYLAILEQLCTILERATQVVRTDWGSLKDVFKDCGEEVPQLGREHMVPMIADIQPLRLLGAGGFGAIYKCILGGAVIAGKLVPLERMRHPKYACVDKMVTSMMNSPFVIRYYSCFATDKAYCTLMEYMRGVDLNRLIKAGDPLDLITIALVFAQLGLAVRYLHFRGFIHRDIKPANVMVLPGCRIKLIDLDTCKVCTSLYGDGYTRSFRNRTYGEFKDSEIAGTMVFFAPETVSRESYGRATDWWALGVTAYCAGTGRVPFRGKNDELKKRIKAAEYRRIRDKPELDHLIERLIQKDPKDRITCARFEEFQEQELFQGIHWENLDGSFLYEVKQLDELMQMNKDGTLSPNPVSERKMRSNRKPRPQLKFSEVTVSGRSIGDSHLAELP